MKRFMQLLERVRDMLARPTFRTLISPGNFRVNYRDGKHTYWMDYGSATNLADAFGGQVVHRNQVTQPQAGEEHRHD